MRRPGRVLESVRTYKSSFYNGEHGRAFPRWLPRKGKKRPIFMRPSRTLLRGLGIRPRSTQHKAASKMWDLLQDLYFTCQSPELLHSAAVA